MNRIDSVANEKVKLAVKIADSSKARKANKMFFLEGLRLCKDAAITGVEIEYAFFTEAALEKFKDDVAFICENANQSYLVSAAVADKLSQTQSSQGFFCTCKLKDDDITATVKENGKYIALENIQDPANLGAICRTAEALGLDGAIIFSGCDIYSPKAQRAAMGSLLRLSIIVTDNLKAELLNCSKKGMKVFATTPDSSVLRITNTDMNGGVVAVIGNEGNGVSEEIFSVCEKITIPMLGRAESLNASMAAAITMWEMVRHGEVKL